MRGYKTYQPWVYRAVKEYRGANLSDLEVANALGVDLNAVERGLRNSRPQVCEREGCNAPLVRHRRRFCSRRCQLYAYNHSEEGHKRTQRYNASETRSECSARWYASGGWYTKMRADLRRHLEKNLDRLEADAA